MRIAYIAPYQGPGLLEKRQLLNNVGLAANVKMELIAELLQRSGHSIEVLSQGEIVDRRTKFYPAFREPKPFDPTIPVLYGSALPIKRVNGIWPTLSTLRLFRRRHQESPFDAVIVYNLKLPQVICGLYAMRRLKLPVILEYEDDSLVDIAGKNESGRKHQGYLRFARKLLNAVSGCIGVSPFLLTRVSSEIPKMLLRGVVGENLIKLGSDPTPRNNWIVFSGTHTETKGLEQLLQAWKLVTLPGWELHIAGYGRKTEEFKKIADGDRSVVFHGSLDRNQNAQLLSRAKIGMNPHDLSATPGNVFAFKIIEYLAAGNHVISTPMGPLESELEAGMTYIPDNAPQTIATSLEQVIRNRAYERTAAEAAWGTYGPAAVSRSLNALLGQVMATPQHNHAASSSVRIEGAAR
jgi:glycosyltransferase involved in cell wall biosynthesis